MTAHIGRERVGGRHLKSMGLRCDGLTDDYNALVDAVLEADEKGWELWADPTDRIYVNGLAEFTDANLFLRGRPVFLFDTDGGMRFAQNTPHATEIDAKFKCMGHGNGPALSIVHDATMMNENRDLSLVRLACNFGDPEDETGGSFLTELQLQDVTGFNLDDCRFRGYRDMTAGNTTEAFRYRAGSKAIEILSPANSQPVRMVMRDPDIQNYDTAIHCVGEMEGLMLVGGKIINSGLMLYADWDNGSDSVNPRVVFMGTHGNCAKGWVKTDGVVNGKIMAGDFYRFPYVDGVGFLGFDIKDATEWHIIDNFFHGWNTVGEPGTVALGDLENFKRSIIRGNQYKRMDRLWNLIGPGCIDNDLGPNMNFADVQEFNYVEGDDGEGGTTPASGPGEQLGWPGKTNTNDEVRTISSANMSNIVAVSVYLNAGQEFEVYTTFSMSKGLTDGNVTLQVIDSDNEATFVSGSSVPLSRPAFPAEATLQEQIVARGRATVAGFYQFILQGQSFGSDCTIAVGKATITAARL